MYYYKITTKDNVLYTGLSSEITQLQNMLNNKLKFSNVSGKIEIFENKKLLASYIETK